MSKEYTIPGDMKRIAEAEAREIGVNPDSNHHIVKRSLAKKYRLPHDKIVSKENVIALEQDFHDAIHNGGTFIDQETGEVIEIEAFTEDDYIFLATTLLGLSEEDFNERNIYTKPEHHRSRKKKAKRRNRSH